jgi:hypothetical protein
MATVEQKSESRLSDKPTTTKPEIGFGSDAIAEQLSRLDLKYMALVPGSSYRGLHDSLVNYQGNSSPEMLICLHEVPEVSLEVNKVVRLITCAGTRCLNRAWLC